MTIARLPGALGVALLATLVLGSLAACTSAPPKPAAQKCAPATAKVAWGTPKEADREPIEAHLLSYDEGVEISTPVQTQADTGASFAFVGDGAFSDISSSSEGAWQRSLLAGVRKTKSVPSGFGDGAAVEPADIHPSDREGKYLVVTEEKRTTVPFTIRCAGHASLAGRVAAVADTGTYSTITQCGTTPKGVAPEIISLMGPACSRS